MQVVGSYNVDFFIRLKRLPQPGETVFCDEILIKHGGKGSNQAVSAARLGGEVSFIGAVGNDEYGKRAFSFWKEENVDASRVKVKEGNTGNAYIFLDETGESSIVVNRGANYLLDEEDVADLEGDVLLTQLEIRERVVRKALKEFQGLRILNPAPAYLEDISILDYVDILTPNEIEFKQLTSSDDLDFGLNELLKRVKTAVIVTLGERGAVIATRGKRVLISAPKVKVVDVTGAGDVFNASLAFFLEKGYDIEDAVEYAVKIASYSVTQLGALGPRWEEVKEFVQEK
ncbi:MAG: bifunctional hydroxymethylpyrimidine kinase/phosphomethylpyrimidine kinase [Candidatus Aramenus sp.]|nr:bifunctional hydroxymethylpyrimidine kinase/phosphomethylpyrimidine kinase [Candidatus Aramenus sp.]